MNTVASSKNKKNNLTPRKKELETYRFLLRMGELICKVAMHEPVDVPVYINDVRF